MAAEVVQMNIRLNAQTKKQADQLIERAGFTTTQFLRALWDQLARPESDEGTVRRILAVATPEEQDANRSLDDRARGGAQFIAHSLERYGVSVSALPAESEQAAMKDAFMTERYGECDV